MYLRWTWGCGTKRGKRKKMIAHKALRIVSLSKFVILVIKRYTFSRCQKKLCNSITFTEEQIFQVYTDNPHDPPSKESRSLIAVISHDGATISRGHYITFARHPDSGVWFQFDDDKISPLSFQDVTTKSQHSIYMLVYGPSRLVLSRK
jgi:ubiquitin C-terminal hydrolase